MRLGFYETALVWDLQHGTLLELDSKRVIKRAILGMQELSDEGIKRLYGQEKKPSEIRWFKSQRQFLW
jgi:hypothetical protein